MGLVIRDLESRYETRNPAQWAWRLKKAEEPMAGNSPILNLKFGRRIKPARRNGKLAREGMMAFRRKLRAMEVSNRTAFFRFLVKRSNQSRIKTSWDRVVGGRWGVNL